MEAVEECGGDVLWEPCGDVGGDRSRGGATQLRPGLHPRLCALGPRLPPQGGDGDRAEFPPPHLAFAGNADQNLIVLLLSIINCFVDLLVEIYYIPTSFLVISDNNQFHGSLRLASSEAASRIMEMVNVDAGS